MISKQELLTSNITKNLANGMLDKMKLSTVLLKHGGFSGSGIILYGDVASRQAMVLTAAHNVLLAAKGSADFPGYPINWQNSDILKHSQTLLNYFKTNVKIHYRALDDTQAQNEAEKQLQSLKMKGITKNQTFSEPKAKNGVANMVAANLINTGDWTTDLCLLRFSYAENEVPRASLLGPRDRTHLQSLLQNQMNFISELKKYATSTKRVSGLRDYQFFQFGYGKPSTDTGDDYTATLDNLKYRVIEPEGTDHYRAIVCEDGEMVKEYQDVLLFQSDTQNTSLPGDSGGPVFAFQQATTAPEIFLLGVNLGSDFFKPHQAPSDSQSAPTGKYNNAITSAYAAFERLHG
ncbi:hypothetical protein [Celerinatantimonas sp. YJH-8]|uniref:hypothetical protein n=1 Tax=Celerinatantimonas sp. YJH-8 TaxID=3228714 RepID=UPI0038C43ABB